MEIVGRTNLLNDPLGGNLIHIKINDKVHRIYVAGEMNNRWTRYDHVIKFPADELTETEGIDIVRLLAKNSLLHFLPPTKCDEDAT
jgi:hypothetical protein